MARPIAHAPVFVQHGRKKAPRDYARDVAKQAFGLLGHAFNACDNPELPYRYSQATRDELMEALAGIFILIEEGKIEELPHVMARTDPRFQRFMEAATAEDK